MAGTKAGAKVALIYLPAGEGGGKQGVDDYLAAGHGTDDLLTLATDELGSPRGRSFPSGAALTGRRRAGSCGTSRRRTGQSPHP